ncbi:putative monooxygenase [Daldinia sp. FL1419]|nr:putative monooxygenase [Daldinia sp. FL1419]
MLDELDASTPDDMPSRDFVKYLLPLKCNYERACGKFIRAIRTRLRKWLASNIPIQYGKYAVRVEEYNDTITVCLEDETSATGDILIGEGPTGPTRKYLLGGRDVRLPLSGRGMEEQLQKGCSCYLVGASLTDESPSFFFVGLNEVLPDGKSGKYYFHMFWRDDEATKKSYWTYSNTKEKLYETALEKTKHLPPKFRSIVEKTGPEGTKTPPLRRYSLTVDLGLLPKGKITLLGDAAYCVPSFRGEGDFHAFLDVLELGKVLTQIRPNNTEETTRVLGDYQDDMLKRGLKAAVWSTIAFDEAWSVDDAGPKIIWGLPVVPLPDERATL